MSNMKRNLELQEELERVKEKVIDFLDDLTSPEMYGHVVPLEIRQRAKILKVTLTD